MQVSVRKPIQCFHLPAVKKEMGNTINSVLFFEGKHFLSPEMIEFTGIAAASFLY
jgi:hypothetical protein